MARKRTRAQNQARYWELRQNQAQEDGGDQEVASVWFDAARMVAHQQHLSGDEKVWEELAATLMNFYQRYTQ